MAVAACLHLNTPSHNFGLLGGPKLARIGPLGTHAALSPTVRDALQGKGPHRQPQKRLGRRLEEVAKAVGGGYCRTQMPSKLALTFWEAPPPPPASSNASLPTVRLLFPVTLPALNGPVAVCVCM